MAELVERRIVTAVLLLLEFSLDCPVPLSSHKITILVMKVLVTALGLPSGGTREETLLMIEGPDLDTELDEKVINTQVYLKMD